MSSNIYFGITICVIFSLKVVSSDQEDLLPTTRKTFPGPRRLADTIFATPDGVPFGLSICNDSWTSFGSDARLIQALANKIGVKKCFNTGDDTMNIDNLLRLLQFRLIDVVGIAWPLYPKSLKGTKYFYPHDRSDLCLLLNKVPAYRWSIFHAYSKESWTAIGIMLVLFVVALYLWEQPAVVLQVFKTFVSGSFPSNKGPKTRKALLLSLSVSGVIFLSAFSGCITSLISVPKESAQIDTLEEANARITGVYAPYRMYEFFRENGVNDVAYKLLKKRIDDQPNDSEFLKNEPTTALINFKYSLDFIQRNTHLDENGQPLSHIVKECLISHAYRAFHVRDDWPYYEMFNVMVMRLFDAGISQWLHSWTLTDFQNLFKETLPKIELKSNDEPVVLSVAAILEPLFLLFAGWALASLAFVLEISWKRMQRPCVKTSPK